MANRIASPKVQRAAKKLVEYLEWDEFKSYSCNLEKDHIFLSVRIIRDWLGMAPEHHDEAEQIAETKPSWLLRKTQHNAAAQKGDHQSRSG